MVSDFVEALRYLNILTRLGGKMVNVGDQAGGREHLPVAGGDAGGTLAR